MYYVFLVDQLDETELAGQGGVVIAESEEEAVNKVIAAALYHGTVIIKDSILIQGEVYPNVTFFEQANYYGN